MVVWAAVVYGGGARDEVLGQWYSRGGVMVGLVVRSRGTVNPRLRTRDVMDADGDGQAHTNSGVVESTHKGSEALVGGHHWVFDVRCCMLRVACCTLGVR